MLLAIFALLLSTPTADAKSILDELALPPVAFGVKADPLPPIPFGATLLQPYAPDVSVTDILKDVEKYRLRVCVLRSLQTVRDTWPLADPKAPKLVDTIDSPVTPATKKAVFASQELVAVALVRLEDELTNLLAVGDLRGKEPKRWQAHYDYTLAQVRMRLAYLNEYNLILANVRTESLPELGPDDIGWRLVSAPLMKSRFEVKKLAGQATDGFTALATTHKGTPWEALAKRAALTPPGLKWETVRK